jgi:alkanesulfonate monooxygenase SsuD/methylene tetrahydromethanopterin reductase-like flavin-dependent oxidoreductase (luciferase family)
MRKLWGEPISAYQGEFVKFDGVRSYPKPVRGAELPVLFGGESTPALRRVAEYGNGWFGFNLAPDEATAKIRKIEELLKANHRKLSEVEIIVSPYTKTITADDLKRYRDAGVHEIVIVNIRPPRTVDDAATRLEEAARSWLEPASKL